MNEPSPAPAGSELRNFIEWSAPPPRDYHKRIIVLTGLGWALLSAGVFFKHFLLPNQILITAAGMLLLVFGSLIFVLRENLQAVSNVPKIWHKAGYGSTALVFWGYFHGWEGGLGFRAIVFYGALVLLILYFTATWRRARAIRERNRHFRNLAILLVSTGLLKANFPFPPQIPDAFFRVSIGAPAYPEDTGPIVWIDEGHNNFHTMRDKYRPFADLLRQDGYRPQPIKETFTMENLAPGRILVVANALHYSNVDDWTHPTLSAFTPEEVAAIGNWVWSGGSLFLIADHAPFAGAAERLAAEFGFGFRNGYASHHGEFPDVFTRKNGMLRSCALTDGQSGLHHVDNVRTFVGQAFTIPADAVAVLVVDSRYRLWHTATAWRRRDLAEAEPIEGLAQLAYREFGQGRAVVAGEAAMFSAQLDGGKSWMPMGMNAPGAEENWRLTINIIRWLERGAP